MDPRDPANPFARSFVAASALAKQTGYKQYLYQTRFLPARSTAYNPKETIMNARLPGEGSEASYLRAFRIRIAEEDPESLAAWAPTQVIGTPPGPDIPEAILIKKRLSVLMPVVPTSRADFWGHQYDLSFRIRGAASKFHKTLIPSAHRFLPVPVRQEISPLHPTLLLTKIVYDKEPGDAAYLPPDEDGAVETIDDTGLIEDGAHAVLVLLFPPRAAEPVWSIDIVSTYALSSYEHDAYHQILAARLRDLRQFNELDPDVRTLIMRTSRRPDDEVQTQMSKMLVNDVAFDLSTGPLRMDGLNLQSVDPKTGHCFAWSMYLARLLLQVAPEEFWLRSTYKERNRTVYRTLFGELNKALQGGKPVADQIWNEMIEWFMGRTYGGRRTRRRRVIPKRRSTRRARIRALAGRS
jgi:hypothetical protein